MPLPDDLKGHKTQYAPRTACNTFPAKDAAAIADRLLVPHVISDVDAYRTIVRTDPALDATYGIRDEVPV